MELELQIWREQVNGQLKELKLQIDKTGTLMIHRPETTNKDKYKDDSQNCKNKQRRSTLTTYRTGATHSENR